MAIGRGRGEKRIVGGLRSLGRENKQMERGASFFRPENRRSGFRSSEAKDRRTSPQLRITFYIERNCTASVLCSIFDPFFDAEDRRWKGFFDFRGRRSMIEDGGGSTIFGPEDRI